MAPVSSCSCICVSCMSGHALCKPSQLGYISKEPKLLFAEFKAMIDETGKRANIWYQSNLWFQQCKISSRSYLKTKMGLHALVCSAFQVTQYNNYTPDSFCLSKLCVQQISALGSADVFKAKLAVMKGVGKRRCDLEWK